MTDPLADIKEAERLAVWLESSPRYAHAGAGTVRALVERLERAEAAGVELLDLLITNSAFLTGELRVAAYRLRAALSYRDERENDA